ncbi:MAG: hypothetical protein BWZ02_03129 [Lentisphaerae bacterium ADurb.BinA184]|nr:MAG: hypothetical protein BWZ02_03129 [Lentisphaerae bacterium ADurb.BinA184]
MSNSQTVATALACPMCAHRWADRDALLGDRATELVGYQVDFVALRAGFFLFHHHAAGCGTTFSVPVGWFADLYDGPVFSERRTGQSDCPGHCLRRGDLRPCGAACECAWVRAVIDVLRRHGKPPRPRPGIEW